MCGADLGTHTLSTPTANTVTPAVSLPWPHRSTSSCAYFGRSRAPRVQAELHTFSRRSRKGSGNRRKRTGCICPQDIHHRRLRRTNVLLPARLVIEFCTILREVSRQIPLKFHQQDCVPSLVLSPKGSLKRDARKPPKEPTVGPAAVTGSAGGHPSRGNTTAAPPAGPAPTGPFSSLERQGLHLVFYNNKPPKTPFRVNT